MLAPPPSAAEPQIMTPATQLRQNLKIGFLRKLPPEQLQYLADRCGIPVAQWFKAPEAVAIARAAVGEGLYSPATVPSDILASLRNLAARKNLKPEMPEPLEGAALDLEVRLERLRQEAMQLPSPLGPLTRALLNATPNPRPHDLLPA